MDEDEDEDKAKPSSLYVHWYTKFGCNEIQYVVFHFILFNFVQKVFIKLTQWLNWNLTNLVCVSEIIIAKSKGHPDIRSHERQSCWLFFISVVKSGSKTNTNFSVFIFSWFIIPSPWESLLVDNSGI